MKEKPMNYETYFFTFPGTSPFRKLYVEVEVRQRPEGTDPTFPANDYEAAMYAMNEAFGAKWGFQYGPDAFESQPSEYGLVRLAKIIVDYPHNDKAEI